MLVDVYRNLTKGCYSVKACEGPFAGKVIAHAESVWLDDPMFRVVQSGRQRVLMERKKYVHAFVRGDLYSLNGVYRFDHKSFNSIPKSYHRHTYSDYMLNNGAYHFTYNPYKHDKFVVPFMNFDVSVRSGHHALLCNELGTLVLAPCLDTD